VDEIGNTPTGVALQQMTKLNTIRDHHLGILAALNKNGAYRFDDTSLVVTEGVLASGFHVDGIVRSIQKEVAVSLLPNGKTRLAFKTTAQNQQVKLTFNAKCGVRADRGTWLGIRIEVDGVEAEPASGYDFALCSALSSNVMRRIIGYRQSVITVPAAGDHTVRVFAKPSASARWQLAEITMVVE
jgi:hypothetical protein